MKIKLVSLLLIVVCVVGVSRANSRTNEPGFYLQTETRQDLRQILRKAYDAYRKGEYDASIKFCDQAIGIAPDDYRAYTIKGLALMALWKLKDASQLFTKSISLRPDIAETYFFKGLAERSLNNFEVALELCRKAIEIDPKFARAYLLTGEILRNKKETRAEAIEAYKTAIRLEPANLKALVELGQTYGYEENYEDAEIVLKEAISADPDKMAGRFELGRILVKQNRLKEARKLWEERKSDEERTFPKFITVLKRAEGLQAAKKEVEENPLDPEALLKLGIAVMEGDHWVVDGRQKKAIVHFRKALSIRPDFAKAQFQICRAYVQIADTYEKENSELDKELAKLRRMDPKLADEIVEYRKTYRGGIFASPAGKEN